MLEDEVADVLDEALHVGSGAFAHFAALGGARAGKRFAAQSAGGETVLGALQRLDRAHGGGREEDPSVIFAHFYAGASFDGHRVEVKGDVGLGFGGLARVERV